MAFKERLTGLLGKRSGSSEAESSPVQPEVPEASATPEKAAPPPQAATPAPATPTPAASAGSVRDRIIEILKTVYDPEIPVDIYELGLIYEVDVRSENNVYIQMTLTTPMCPVAETLPPEVESKVRGVEGVEDVELELVWDPPWNPEMMSEAAKLTLNF